MFISNVETMKAFQLFRPLGFSDEQIIMILKKWNTIKNDLDTMKENFPTFEQYLLDLNYTKEQIRDLAANYPKAMTYKKQSTYYKRYPSVLASIKDRVVESDKVYRVNMERIRDLLRELGLAEERIERMFYENVAVIFDEPHHVQQIISYLMGIGLSKKEIATCAGYNCKILELDEHFYQSVEEVIAPYHIPLVDILRIKMKKRANFNFDGLFALFDIANALKVDKDKFKKSLFANPNCLNCSPQVLYEFSKNFKKLGFDEDGMRSAMENSLVVIAIDYKTLKKKKDILVNYYDEKKALDILLRFPAYFTMSENSINEKLYVAFFTNSLDYIYNNPKNLMQSAELTLARFYYFCGSCSSRALFLGEKEFIRHYKITNKEVLEKYRSGDTGSEICLRKTYEMNCKR